MIRRTIGMALIAAVGMAASFAMADEPATSKPAETAPAKVNFGTVSGTITLQAAPTVDIDAMAKTVQKSLVIVEWTYRDVNLSSERTGQGIVVNKDTVLVWGNFISENTPKEYVKEIKIRLPGKNFDTVKGTFLGRTQNRLFAYIKADKPLDAPPLDLSKTAPVKLGERIFSVAMLDKNGGYETYVGGTEVKAIQKRAFTLAGTSVFGLTRANSPVYDSATGALVGITAPPSGEEFFLRVSPTQITRIELIDELQSGSLFLFDEMKAAFTNIPDKPFESPRPWTGVGGLNGLEESVRDLYSIPERSGVVIGSVIPGEAADKAGLLPRDIILAIDGKPFSDSPVAELMTSHFQGAIDKHKPGDKITLTILRDTKRKDVVVTLGKAPKVVGEYEHVYEPKTGVVTRDIGFWDSYERRLGDDVKGVVVELVKNGAAASLGQNPLRKGYIITKVDDQPIENIKQFNDLVKKEAEDPDKKEIVFSIIGPDNESKVCRVDLAK